MIAEYYTERTESERRVIEWLPQPPRSMLWRWLDWYMYRLPETNAQSQVQHRAKATKRVFDDMPRWPREVSNEERRSVINKRLLKAIDGWDGVSSLVILGPTDNGKTVGLVELAVQAIVRRTQAPTFWRERMWPVPYFTKALTLTQAWRAQKLGEEGDPPCVAAAKDSQLLLLDDLGQEPNDPQAALWSVIDSRYDDRRPTLMTSGLTVDGLIERYGDAFIRRLCDACGKNSGRVIDLWSK